MSYDLLLTDCFWKDTKKSFGILGSGFVLESLTPGSIEVI
jgi:hypothetical protein